MTTFSDLDLYHRLSAMAAELEQMASAGCSLVGNSALQTASMSLRGIASAVYEHSLSQDDQPASDGPARSGRRRRPASRRS